MSRNLLIEPVKASETADEVDIQCCESDVESEYDKTLWCSLQATILWISAAQFPFLRCWKLKILPLQFCIS